MPTLCSLRASAAVAARLSELLCGYVDPATGLASLQQSLAVLAVRQAERIINTLQCSYVYRLNNDGALREKKEPHGTGWKSEAGG